MNYAEETYKILKEFEEAKKRKEEELAYLKQWSKDSQKLICVFGAGAGGGAVLSTYQQLGINIDCFCDNDMTKWGEKVWGDIKCMSVNELLPYEDNVLFIISLGTSSLELVYNQLKQLGIRNIVKHSESQLFLELKEENSDFNIPTRVVESKMREVLSFVEDDLSRKVLYYRFKYLIARREELNDLNFGDVFTKDQYFIESGKYLNADDIIADCGSFDGDTLRYLLNEIKFDKFEKYICYELNPNTYKQLEKNIERLPEKIRAKIVLRPFGVAGRNDKILLGGQETYLVTLDSMEEQTGLSFLKMDIEGFELESLAGAEEILKKDKPQCAICAYHKISDMWTIPILLHQLLPEYQILFRHHQYSYSETVCYALRRK